MAVVKILRIPAKVVRGIILSALGGLTLLFILSIVGDKFGAQLGLNTFNIAVAGILGLPGIGVLLFVKLLLGT